ncbi:MAG: DUF1376 domain-containing protein [Rhodocyclaceae bacterium]|nr:DUF1376 domain-containing protein [Rhodocyclaceae bacterium]
MTAPLVDQEVDLRGMPYLPIELVRLLDSDTYALSTGDEFKAAFSLWCKSFLQVPAASLPDDDRVLAHLSGAGANWPGVRDVALRGWIKCNDGRLYHPVVAEKAREAWRARVAQRTRTQAAREAKALLARAQTQQLECTAHCAEVTTVVTADVATCATTPKRKGKSEGVISPEANASVSDGDLRPPSVPDCPHEAIIAAYHELLPSCPRVREWTAARRALLRNRWREKALVAQGYRDDPLQGVVYWRRYFQYVSESKFLIGQTDGRDGKPPFVADLEWLLRPGNFAKVVEGKYHHE